MACFPSTVFVNNTHTYSQRYSPAWLKTLLQIQLHTSKNLNMKKVAQQKATGATRRTDVYLQESVSQVSSCETTNRQQSWALLCASDVSCMDWERYETDSHSDPAVSRLDVASCVPDVTMHLIVGEIRLLNQLRGVHCHLRNSTNSSIYFF